MTVKDDDYTIIQTDADKNKAEKANFETLVGDVDQHIRCRGKVSLFTLYG